MLILYAGSLLFKLQFDEFISKKKILFIIFIYSYNEITIVFKVCYFKFVLFEFRSYNK